MSMELDSRLLAEVQNAPYPLLFATISGAHLYGFSSPDSDYDLRGVHILPARELLGLKTGDETIEKSNLTDGFELDLVTHEAKKFFKLLLKKNGYVLEQLYSPLVVHTTEEHEQLKSIAVDCITRHHAHHYLGFSETQWRLFAKEEKPRAKPLLYVFRVLLTGIHLMKTGELEANLVNLNRQFNLPYIPDLIALKTGSNEKAVLKDADIDRFEKEFKRLREDLENAYASSYLPEAPSAAPQLHELLLQIRFKYSIPD